jgi:hypothetical protein
MAGKRVEKPHPEDDTQAPHDWDKAVSVAYLRLQGASQEAAGNAGGVTRDTVGRWESCSWWPDALAEASRRWLSGLAVNVRNSLVKLTDSKAPEPATVRFAAERIIPGLEPPTNRTDVTSGGQPLPDSLTIRYIDPREDD